MSRHKYLLEIIQISEKKHIHMEKRTSNLFLMVESTLENGDTIEIEVEPKDLYEVPHGCLSGTIVWLKTGQRKHYLMVVNKEGKAIKEIQPAISGKVLRVARDWKGLDRAISDSFGSDLPLGRIALIGAVLVGVVIAGYLVWKGFIPTPRSWGL